ncbi:MAG TPA: hypothetical protein VNX29_11820 [Kaistia sp.]|nr:hypothetical protein [Kaistia sp.]
MSAPVTRGTAGPPPVSAGDLWWLVPGFALWFSALSAVYALHHIGCTFGWSSGAIHLGLALALVAHLAAIALFWHFEMRRVRGHAHGETGRFLHWVILGTLLAAFVKTLLTIVPALFLTVCL